VKKGILIVALFLLCLTTTQAMAASGKTVRLGHGQTAGSAVDNFAQALAKAVNEKSKGALNVQVFPRSQLGKERDMVAWKLLGAAVTPLDISEVFLGLRQGTMDAQENPLEIISS
jgi:TRAP-type C4-dicarboxylate transport system substrate-binding protein